MTDGKHHPTDAAAEVLGHLRQQQERALFEFGKIKAAFQESKRDGDRAPLDLRRKLRGKMLECNRLTEAISAFERGLEIPS